MYVCMYVCMSVTGLRFTHNLCTFLASAAHGAIVIEVKVKNSEDRRRCQNKSRDIKDG